MNKNWFQKWSKEHILIRSTESLLSSQDWAKNQFNYNQCWPFIIWTVGQITREWRRRRRRRTAFCLIVNIPTEFWLIKIDNYCFASVGNIIKIFSSTGEENNFCNSFLDFDPPPLVKSGNLFFDLSSTWRLKNVSWRIRFRLS